MFSTEQEIESSKQSSHQLEKAMTMIKRDDRYSIGKGSCVQEEWYLSWKQLRTLLLTELDKLVDALAVGHRRHLSLLVIGCGTSTLSHDLYLEGFTSVTSIDYSEAVINKMKRQHPNCPGLTYLVADVRNLAFADGTFCAVIDKAVLDALLCGSESDTAALLREAQRVLRPGGRFLLITFGQPSARVPLLTQPPLTWTVGTNKIDYESDDEYEDAKDLEDVQEEDGAGMDAGQCTGCCGHRVNGATVCLMGPNSGCDGRTRYLYLLEKQE